MQVSWNMRYFGTESSSLDSLDYFSCQLRALHFWYLCIAFFICALQFFNFRYNISFIDPPLDSAIRFPSVMIFSSGQSPSENIITSGNITPNPHRSGSINDNYRPISLFSVFNKLLEKLMYNRLSSFLENLKCI
jgi:hypothetical protein